MIKDKEWKRILKLSDCELANEIKKAELKLCNLLNINSMTDIEQMFTGICKCKYKDTDDLMQVRVLYEMIKFINKYN